MIWLTMTFSSDRMVLMLDASFGTIWVPLHYRVGFHALGVVFCVASVHGRTELPICRQSSLQLLAQRFLGRKDQNIACCC